MNRAIVLGSIIAVGALSLGVRASQQPQGAPKTIDVDKLKDNLYVLKGGGGNTAVFISSNGVVVVDAKNPGWGQPILEKIRTLTDKPVITLINTHTHGDHVSGNVEFPATVDIIVQENTKTNMEKMDIFKQNDGKGMPKRTFKDKMTVGKDADQVDLYYFGRGHTNGDAFIVFPALRTMHAGDIFAGKNLPLIDTSNGGNAVEIGQSLQKAHDNIKNVDTIITGHAQTTMTWQDLQDYATMNKDFVQSVQDQLKAGKSVDEVAAAGYKVPEGLASKGFTGNAPTLMGGMKGLVQGISDDSKK
jgi:glyoxylase-like metal-dependent hydrolase (beta-lactamase superfamily II)